MCKIELEEIENECKETPCLRGAILKAEKWGSDDYSAFITMPDGRKSYHSRLPDFNNWLAGVMIANNGR
jgi:hypothetical protein